MLGADNINIPKCNFFWKTCLKLLYFLNLCVLSKKPCFFIFKLEKTAKMWNYKTMLMNFLTVCVWFEHTKKLMLYKSQIKRQKMYRVQVPVKMKREAVNLIQGDVHYKKKRKIKQLRIVLIKNKNSRAFQRVEEIFLHIKWKDS